MDQILQDAIGSYQFNTFILNDMSSMKYYDGTMYINAQEMC